MVYCPLAILRSAFTGSNTTELRHLLCTFVKEARCDDIEPYTPRSLRQLLSGIQLALFPGPAQLFVQL